MWNSHELIGINEIVLCGLHSMIMDLQIHNAYQDQTQ